MTTLFTGHNYSIEFSGHQFILVHPVSENETFDTLDELIESNPCCEPSRTFFFPSVADQKIVIVNNDGHEWNGRPVLRIESCDGFSTVELLEQQSLPSEQRMIVKLHDSLFNVISFERQQQIASTMGLRIESLPY